MTPKQRLHAVIEGRCADRVGLTPIFMIWAAHNINRTYRDYYLDSDVLAASNLALARDFEIDQLSTISDPWREASAYGMQFDYPDEAVGIPKAHLLNSPSDINLLKNADLRSAPRTRDRIEAVRKLAEAAGDTYSVLGWVEGPMAEYSDLRDLSTALMDFMDNPAVFVEASHILVDKAIDFALAQVKVGADMIGVGDAAASLIGPELYEQYVLPAQKRLFAAIHAAGVKAKLHICGNIAPIIHLMAKSGADVIDVDWMVPLDQARKAVGPSITLCGNMDPAAVMLQGTAEQVFAAARDCIAKAGPRFILMPGCEIPPGTPRENIQALCRAVLPA